MLRLIRPSPSPRRRCCVCRGQFPRNQLLRLVWQRSTQQFEWQPALSHVGVGALSHPVSEGFADTGDQTVDPGGVLGTSHLLEASLTVVSPSVAGVLGVFSHPASPLQGRSVYLCSTLACVEGALSQRGKKLHSALKTRIPGAILGALDTWKKEHSARAPIKSPNL